MTSLIKKDSAMKRVFLVALVATVFAGFPALSAGGIITAGTNGDPTYVLTPAEDPNTGFQGNLTPLNVTITVASDGESFFDPFGFGQDTSDQIKFDQSSVGPAAVNLNPAWVQFTASDGNPFSWANPAIGENGNPTEAVGLWSFPGFTVGGGPLIYEIVQQDGSLSDRITISNDANGVAQLQFESDPSFVPEPSSLILLGLGAVGLSGYRWRRHKAAPAKAC
jgi:hypothetical protein